MRDEKNVNYTITWTQPLENWSPILNIPLQETEPEITDFTEAQEVLSKIMSKFDNK